ncbi:TPA: hypothetical protein DCW38_01375 [candidate division WOR-3 bacterium]|jgi:flavin-dependent thymidylate synthase|uniref:Thymidylate synthase (FAD) n=1 Tax=candidate division WOR-3 bacterium TaxID=2052148 RepID=A0A350H8F2_UNCW3|nr:hypothetical protein [candidate division WOR-3 bacterium]
MKIILSGYNVDRDALKESSATPETISAAYARISRSEKTIPELRREARADVAKARASNEKIVFGLGHSSIAEHAVFNFDLMGISRIAIEYIQSHRIASYTEKSQRYVSLASGYHIPEELESNGKLQNEYRKFCDMCFDSYFKAQKVLSEKDLSRTKTNEDARYMLPLATYTQCGLTINGRSLEYLISNLRSQNSAELENIGKMMLSEIEGIAPSIIKYTSGRNIFKKESAVIKYSFPNDNLQIISFDKNQESSVISALKFRKHGTKFNARFKAGDEEKEELKRLLFSLNEFDRVPREFEFPEITFIVYCSASCFAQLKRHRMSTVIPQSYSYREKPFIPHSFRNTPLEEMLINLHKKSVSLSRKMESINPDILQYTALNASKRAVLVKMNCRELYHFVRLRSDKHAQLEIREISDKLAFEANRISPVLYSYLSGKDEFKILKEKSV